MKKCQVKKLIGNNQFFKIFDYLRIPESDQMLIIYSIVSDFFIGYPYVIVYIHGSSGKGKSVGSKCVRNLLDATTILDVGLLKKSDVLLQKIVTSSLV